MDFNSAIVVLGKTCGVYCAMHLETMRLYVGSSFNCGVRIKTHLRDSKNGSLSCFHRALRQFGVGAFSFDLLEECERPLLHEREEHWIRFYSSASLEGFNTMSKPGATYGWFMTDATKQRMSEAQKRASTPEKREKLRNAMLGKKRPEMSAEWRENISRANLGRKFSAESRAKISKALTGKRLSDATRKKIGDVRRGRNLPREWVEKVRMAMTGKKFPGRILSAEHKANIGKGCKGKMLGIKLSLEHRKKLSDAHKGKKWSAAQRAGRMAYHETHNKKP